MLFIALSLTVLSLVRRFGQKRLLNVNVNVTFGLDLWPTSLCHTLFPPLFLFMPILPNVSFLLSFFLFFFCSFCLFVHLIFLKLLQSSTRNQSNPSKSHNTISSQCVSGSHAQVHRLKPSKGLFNSK